MTRPGIFRNLDLSVLGSHEQSIARNFRKLWYLTFARKQEFKYTEFPFFFARPVSELVNTLPIEREVLVLFSSQSMFDARALDFVDKIMVDFQNRLDKLCILLISRDPAIRKKIRDLAMQERELRVIVPFTYGDFLNSSDDPNVVIMQRLKEFLYMRDLFAVESPLQHDTQFFGRTKAIQQLDVRYKTGLHSGLFGLRKIGKTSSLYAIKRRLETRGEPVVYIDCSEPSFHQRRWFETLQFLIANLISTNPKLGSVKPHDERSYDSVHASEYFEQDLLAIYNAAGQHRILFILDEIESITFELSASTHWANEQDFVYFWQSLRAIYQKKPYLFSCIIAGVNPRSVETDAVHGNDNPIYKFLAPAYLDLFTVDEVRDMVSSIGTYMGLLFEDQIFTYLTDDFGGHPFLIRQACSQLHNNIKETRPVTITRYFYQAERSKLIRGVQDYIAAILNVLQRRYKDEYQLLEYLAQGDHKTFVEFAEMSPTVIQHLLGYGLVAEERGRYFFRIKAVEEYVQEHARIRRPAETIEEKWREMSERRNKLEVALRQIVKTVLKTYFGPEEAKKKVIDVLSKQDQKTKMSSLAYEGMFQSDLYFMDLKKIIIKYWDQFGPIFSRDREKFQLLMDQVNRFRVDAHANDISAEDLAVVRIALDWLQDRTTKYLA
jgi:hypothetical protein